MAHSKARCVMLDMGKVLLDFDFGRFGCRMSELTGLGIEALREAITSGGLSVKYESGKLSDADFHHELCRRMGRDVPWREFVEAWNSIFLAIPMITEERLANLAMKSDLWVISNTNRIHFSFISERYSFLRHFKGFILSHEVGALKPDPDIFHCALSKAGVEAGEALFVDDLAANVDAARQLGIDAFQFLDSEQFAAELQLRDLL